MLLELLFFQALLGSFLLDGETVSMLWFKAANFNPPQPTCRWCLERVATTHFASQKMQRLAWAVESIWSLLSFACVEHMTGLAPIAPSCHVYGHALSIVTSSRVPTVLQVPALYPLIRRRIRGSREAWIRCEYRGLIHGRWLGLTWEGFLRIMYQCTVPSHVETPNVSFEFTLMEPPDKA